MAEEGAGQEAFRRHWEERKRADTRQFFFSCFISAGPLSDFGARCRVSLIFFGNNCGSKANAAAKV